MGVKKITKHLNATGIRTRDGGRWGIGAVHKVLTRTTYTGRHRFNTRFWKTRERKPDTEVVEMAVPPIIEASEFEAVQALLKTRSPALTAPRIVSGPTLLTGICFCAACGKAMTLRTGKGGRYRYYTCSTKARQGETGCLSRTVLMEKLDRVVADHIEQRLLQPKRLEEILSSVLQRREKGESMNGDLEAGLENYHPSEERLQHTKIIDARLAEFDKHRADLLEMLRKVCDRKPKTPFDEKKAWKSVRFAAWSSLEREARIEESQMGVPAANRVKLFGQIGNALHKARCKIDEVKQKEFSGHLFLEWAILRGHQDFTHPITGVLEDEFYGLLADLARLEEAAFRAADEVRQKCGRPGGRTVLQYDFIVDLKFVYRHSTGKAGGSGPGPFARFVGKFLKAIGHESILEQNIIEAIKAAKKRAVP